MLSVNGISEIPHNDVAVLG